MSAELLRTIRANPAGVQPQRVAVAFDPSGGGRDTAGVVGGFLGDDQRVWITHEQTDANGNVRTFTYEGW